MKKRIMLIYYLKLIVMIYMVKQWGLLVLVKLVVSLSTFVKALA